MRYLLISFFLFIVLHSAKAADEQLLVFTNAENPVLTIDDIKGFQKLAEELELELKIIDINQGAPEEITYTPSIVFQNYKGRSFYYGRYKNTSRLQNFVRTSRMAHQQRTTNSKKDILVWKNGRTTITAPLKLTELSGKVSKKIKRSGFTKKTKNWVQKGMNTFQQMEEINVERSTRSFYFNLYPHLGSKKNLTISAEIFSQYNCVKPVCQVFGDGFVQGKWKDREALFAKAGQLIEQEIIRLAKASNIGDALQFIPQTIPTKSWEVLGLELPEKPAQKEIASTTEVSIPKEWKVEAPLNKQDPILIFSFLAPVDNYAGEVKALEGTMKLGDDGSMQGATGTFEVQIKDVTMGADDFDNEVQNKMLKKSQFPKSTFTFAEIEGSDAPLQFGTVSHCKIRGVFTLLGVETTLEVPAQIEPILNEEGEVRLQVNTAFQLALFEQYKVEGPDGPSPAKDTLQFFMKFNLQSK